MKLKSLAIIVGMVFVILLGLEIAVRVYMFAKSKNIIYLRFNPTREQITRNYNMPKVWDRGPYFKFKPGVYDFVEQPGEITYTINSKGFRTAEFSDNPPAGVTRIVCFGGSTTMCSGVQDDATYPYYLQKMLGNRFEVVNAGIGFYHMKEIYYLFKEEIVNYKPDVITIFEAFNDAHTGNGLVFSRAKTNLCYKLYKLLYFRCLLYTVLVEKYSLIKNKYFNPFENELSFSSEEYVEYLKQTIDLAKKKNIKVILIKQPIDAQIDCDKETIESLRQKIETARTDSPMINSHDARLVYAQCALVKEMERVGEEEGLIVVDPLKEIKGSEFFIDIIHLSPKGNEILAKVIAEKLRTQMYKR